jgi:biopolymer transport protein ExbD
MKFPRTTQILKGQFDAVPYLCVLFPMAFFLAFKDMLVLPPGTVLILPGGLGQPALDPGRPTVAVAITSSGRLFFENQWITEEALSERLKGLPEQLGEPPVLIIYADASLPYHAVIRVGEIGRRAGVAEVLLGGAPAPTSQPLSRPVSMN